VIELHLPGDINDPRLPTVARCLLAQAGVVICDCGCQCNCYVFEGLAVEIRGIVVRFSGREVWLRAWRTEPPQPAPDLTLRQKDGNP